MVIDHAYAELGLAPGASQAQVKAAWRRLVAQWHPDRNAAPGALARMQRINTAYERLRDDPIGPAAAQDAGPAAAPSPAPGRPLRRRVRLSLEEAASGCVKQLRGRRHDPCGACDGAGHAVPAMACPACEGRGELRRPAWYGWMSSTTRCAACAGEGRTQVPCTACAGSGRHPRTYRHSVRIPPGARRGDLLQAATPAGPFELQIDLAPHPFFTLDDDGVLRCEVPVDGFAWMAERWVEVPTLAGLQQMKLQRGHQVYRLRGQGFPDRAGAAAGDCVVHVVPRFPDTLSAEQEALLAQLEASSGGALQDWRRRLQAWARRQGG